MHWLFQSDPGQCVGKADLALGAYQGLLVDGASRTTLPEIEAHEHAASDTLSDMFHTRSTLPFPAKDQELQT